MSPLRWTYKGTRRLAKELAVMGHQISRTVVGEMLNAQQFGLQGDRKTLEGGQSPDCDAQFHHINQNAGKALADNQRNCSPGGTIPPLLPPGPTPCHSVGGIADFV